MNGLFAYPFSNLCQCFCSLLFKVTPRVKKKKKATQHGDLSLEKTRAQMWVKCQGKRIRTQTYS